MSLYNRHGDKLIPTTKQHVIGGLPTGTYEVQFGEMIGFYLTPFDDYVVTSKVYGKTEYYADRVLNTFDSRPFSTGLLLTGEKGSGKTLLAKVTSQRAREAGISTLVVNSPMYGPAFNQFIQSISEPCIVMFDEFEKVYHQDEMQGALLTLLDGVYSGKKLFILTSNDSYKINQHMMNRPGRVFYHLKYGGVDHEFIREYCTDNLINKSYTEQIINVSSLFDVFNFDLLKALVEEMNRYGESAVDALSMLNAKPTLDGSRGVSFDCAIRINGYEVDNDDMQYAVMGGNPLLRHRTVQSIRIPPDILNNKKNIDNDDNDEDDVERALTPVSESPRGEVTKLWFSFEFDNESLVECDVTAGKYVYRFVTNDEAIELTLIRQKAKEYDWKRYII